MDAGPVIRIAILGSTGSIGVSTLNVVRRHPDLFQIVALSANRRMERLVEQVEEFRPSAAVIVHPPDSGTPAQSDASWSTGREALVELAGRDDVDVVVNACVGFAGLEPTLRALETGKRLALANKESLVAGGPLVQAAAARGGGELVPVDSEHSAILQCVQGAETKEIRRLVLTASGGPFRGCGTSSRSRR